MLFLYTFKKRMSNWSLIFRFIFLIKYASSIFLIRVSLGDMLNSFIGNNDFIFRVFQITLNTSCLFEKTSSLFNTLLIDASFFGQKGTLMTISFFGSLNNQSGIIKSTFSDENLEMLDSTKRLGNLLSGTLLLFLILLLQASN